jgi:hypothetical protein
MKANTIALASTARLESRVDQLDEQMNDDGERGEEFVGEWYAIEKELDARALENHEDPRVREAYGNYQGAR